MKILLSIMFVFLLSFSNFSFALDCYAVINGENKTTEVAAVDDIIIPESSKNNEIIWTSEKYTRQVLCNNAEFEESVYFYPFPNVDLASLPSGMAFGLIYNGKSYDLTADIAKIQTDIIVPQNGSKTGTINVQIYIKKTGNISGGYQGQLPIYQLDGQNGLNINSNAKNFRFSLSNLSNIATGDCTYTLSDIKSTKVITINDNLISNGQTLTSVGSASVTCTPANLLRNRTANINLYTKNASGSGLFGTNKNGLGYQLLMSGNTILPSMTSSSPAIVSFNLDTDGKATKTFDQKVFLTTENEDWLYTNEAVTATSNNPNLGMSINSFE